MSQKCHRWFLIRPSASIPGEKEKPIKRTCSPESKTNQLNLLMTSGLAQILPWWKSIFKPISSSAKMKSRWRCSKFWIKGITQNQTFLNPIKRPKPASISSQIYPVVIKMNGLKFSTVSWKMRMKKLKRWTIWFWRAGRSLEMRN